MQGFAWLQTAEPATVGGTSEGGLKTSINLSVKIAGDKHLPPSMHFLSQVAHCLPAPSVCSAQWFSVWAQVPDGSGLLPGLAAPTVWRAADFSHLQNGNNSSATHVATTGIEQALQRGGGGRGSPGAFSLC